jgi:hypothetical protein
MVDELYVAALIVRGDVRSRRDANKFAEISERTIQEQRCAEPRALLEAERDKESFPPSEVLRALVAALGVTAAARRLGLTPRLLKKRLKNAQD